MPTRMSVVIPQHILGPLQRPLRNPSRIGRLEQRFGRLGTSGQLLAQERDGFFQPAQVFFGTQLRFGS